MTYYTLTEINSNYIYAPLGFEEDFNTRLIEEHEIYNLTKTLDVDYRKIKKPIHIKWVKYSNPYTNAINFKNVVYIFTNQTVISRDFNESVNICDGRKFWNREVRDKNTSIVKFNVSRKAEREKYL
ncbi:MAG: hypothetical protein ACW98D_19455 [Promethearchaeota archaeon]|jgi:hypothetical protein